MYPSSVRATQGERWDAHIKIECCIAVSHGTALVTVEGKKTACKAHPPMAKIQSVLPQRMRSPKTRRTTCKCLRGACDHSYVAWDTHKQMCTHAGHRCCQSHNTMPRWHKSVPTHRTTSGGCSAIMEIRRQFSVKLLRLDEGQSLITLRAGY